MLHSVDEDEKVRNIVPTPGGNQEMWFLTENVDYVAANRKRLTAQGNETTYNEYYISIDMAKEICMIQRSEIGRKFRQYFIECEKKLRESTPKTLPSDYKKALLQLVAQIEEKIVEMHNIETTVIQENETASQNIAELIKQNAKAEINIAELDERNALALEHETTLDDKISTADNKAGILDEKFAIADDKTTLLQSTIDNAVQTKTDLDALNEDAKNTKAELDEANAFATEQIDIIKSFDASTTVQDVNDLKAEVHKARSTFSDLDARITEAEGSGGFFMNDTLPDISNRKSGILYMQIL